MKSMSGFGGGVASLSMKTAAGGGGGIVTNNLVLHLDAGDSNSYSGSGTTWTDLSGQGNHATLINNPTYSSNNEGYLNFDGSNDYATLPNMDLTGNEATFSIWTYCTTTAQSAALIFLGDSTAPHGNGRILNVHLPYEVTGGQYYFDKGHDGSSSASYDRINGYLSSSTYLNQWVNWAFTANAATGSMKVYRNGLLFDSGTGKTKTFSNSDGDMKYIAYSGTNHYEGHISNLQLYKKELSLSEVTQNFNATKGRFGIGEIITDNLVLNLDAGDSSSYSGSGNTWTDLSSSNNNGTINGATYNSGNGGYFDFDGSNDSISFTLSNDFAFGTGDFTIEAWVRFDNTGDGGTIAETRENAVGNPAREGLGFGMRSNRITIWSGVTNTFIIDKTLSLSLDAWHHVVVSRNSGTLKSYINGVEETSSSNTHNFTRRNLFIGRNINDSSTGGTNWGNQDQALLRIYKGKGFSASEVQQNFDATKSRYNAIINNNLVLHLDAGDSSSYSGSGTSWTDLTGNGNNGTLVNGVSYSSSNGGYLIFDGSNDRVDFSTYVQPAYTSSSSFTWFIWVYPTTYSNNDVIMGNRVVSGSNVWTKLTPSRFEWKYPDHLDGSGTDVTQNQWQNICIVKNGSSFTYYKNGTSIDTMTSTHSKNYTNPFYLGGDPSYGENPACRISIVAVYDAALTASEVQQNFNATKGRYGI